MKRKSDHERAVEGAGNNEALPGARVLRLVRPEEPREIPPRTESPPRYAPPKRPVWPRPADGDDDPGPTAA